VKIVIRVTFLCFVALLASTFGSMGCASKAQQYGEVEVVARVNRALGHAELVKRSSAAVAVIETDVGRGMGFVIDPSGYLLTNRHVIEDADHISHVTFLAADPPRTYHSVQIVYIDPVRDLALLRLNTAGDALPHLPLASRRVVPVERYLGASDPVVLLERRTDDHDDETLSEKRGRISELAVYNSAAGPGPFVGVTTPVQRGQSGGPVLDRFGRAVGVVTWTWRDRHGGYAIPISEATAMLAERPRLEDDEARRVRAAERSRAFLEALGHGDVERARRITSPSHARRVREDALGGILAGLDDGGGSALHGFMGAVESLVDPDRYDGEEALEGLRRMVARTGNLEFREAMGIDATVDSRQVVSFFLEFGQAYLAARRYGAQDPTDALNSALLRLQTVDAARTFAIADALAELAGTEVEIESIELVPAAYAPRAVIRLRSRGTKREGPMTSHVVQTHASGEALVMHMRLEWGDWYVARITRAPTPRHP
jgi:S1-C subfamily serine protease